MTQSCRIKWEVKTSLEQWSSARQQSHHAATQPP